MQHELQYELAAEERQQQLEHRGQRPAHRGGIYQASLGLYATRQYTPELADDAELRALVGVWQDQAEAWARPTQKRR